MYLLSIQLGGTLSPQVWYGWVIVIADLGFVPLSADIESSCSPQIRLWLLPIHLLDTLFNRGILYFVAGWLSCYGPRYTVWCEHPPLPIQDRHFVAFLPLPFVYCRISWNPIDPVDCRLILLLVVGLLLYACVIFGSYWIAIFAEDWPGRAGA